MRRTVLTLVCLYALSGAAMLGWTWLWPDPDIDLVPQADAILCLGGGVGPNGTLPNAVEARVSRCTQLHAAGKAPLVIFTGGGSPGRLTEAEAMALYAIAQGLPRDAILRETRAQSTLQNALFSLQIAPRADRVVIVTEAFHLPRSAASVRWAAWQLGLPQPNITQVMSEQVRTSGTAHILFRESLALWFNAARAAAFSAWPGAPEAMLR